MAQDIITINSVWIGIIVSIGTATFAHIIIAIWWASKINTTLQFVREALNTLINTIAKHDEGRYTKGDASRDFALRDVRIDEAHKRLDNCQLKNRDKGDCHV